MYMNKILAVLGVLATLALATPAMAQSVVPTGYGYAQPYTVAPTYAQPYCPTLSYNLYAGLSDYYTGGQVTMLQQYLAAQGYNQPVTGYFGSITRANVAAFQQARGIYPVTGGVGPITRSVIARLCGGTTYNPGYGTFAITNISGPTSLNVGQSGTWTLSTNAPYGSYLSTSVRWGDEGYYPYATAASAPGYVSSQTSLSHTYQQAGTYTITFTVSDNYGHTQSASQTVVVGGGTSCNPCVDYSCRTPGMYYTCPAPVGGLTITSPTAGQTYSRGTQMPIAWSGLIHQTFAAEQDSSIVDLYSVAGGKVGTIAIQNGISGNYTWNIPAYPQNYMCTMLYPNGLCGTNIPDGQYYIKVTVVVGSGFDSNATVIGTAQSGVFTMTGAGGCTSNCSANFSASPTSGQAPLSVQFTSTGPSGSDIGSTVTFGDGTSGTLAMAPVCYGCALQGSVNHTYTQNGTYTAQLRSSNGNVIGTATVYVSGTTGQYSPVANPTSGAVPFTTTFSIPNYTGSYQVNFGDGTSASLVSGSVSHTYYNRGTYTATFMSDYACLHGGGAICAVAQINLGSVTVTAY